MSAKDKDEGTNVIDESVVQDVDVLIQGVNILGVIRKINTRNRRLQAILLSQIEMSIDKSSPGFGDLRKLLLDETNSYTRAVIREIFGDIEYYLRR